MALETSGILRAPAGVAAADSSIDTCRPCAAMPLPPCLPRLTASAALRQRSDWRPLRKLLPYVWQWRWRVAVALAFLVAAKLANVGVPLVLKHLVDALDLKPGDPRAVLVVPVALLLAYGALRLSITLFTELREFLFYPVAARIARRVSLRGLRAPARPVSLRFHLERQTGGVSRDIERGSRAIQSLLNYSIYNILPTLVEITLVHRPAGGQVRRLVRGHHPRRAGDLHRLHRHGDRVAHAVPARDERAGLEGQHTRDRRAAQLRDRQVLPQRALRAGALRRQPAAAGAGVDQVADLAVAAQPRPEPDHRDGRDAAGWRATRRRGRRHA